MGLMNEAIFQAESLAPVWYKRLLGTVKKEHNR